MSLEFRGYLRQIGSGPHTSESLDRQQAGAAMRLMLHQEATPAQIGAFLIAHRIKRPTGEELAGMLDAYHALGPNLKSIAAAYPVVSLNVPYDGRSRTAPLAPLIALVLATAGIPVVTHGGDRMPTKAGLSLIELWRGLGVDWSRLDLSQIDQVLAQTGLGFVYLPRHFPLAQALVTYREEIGKRPPIATLELLWSPYTDGKGHRVCGFVHPPTEGMFRDALDRHGLQHFTTVKGLEGSCDLPRDRTNIIGLNQADGFERLTLHPLEWGYGAKELPLPELAVLLADYAQARSGQESDLTAALIWNCGFYLWRLGVSADMAAGLVLGKELLRSGKVEAKLTQVQTLVMAS
jgi:anthranilate phosphoribosyltransferase